MGGPGAGLQDDEDMIVIGDLDLTGVHSPKMSAVVHHAGTGTTAAGCGPGPDGERAQLHHADQPFWASRVTNLWSRTEEAVPYKSLTAGSLTTAISDAGATLASSTAPGHRKKRSNWQPKTALSPSSKPVPKFPPMIRAQPQVSVGAAPGGEVEGCGEFAGVGGQVQGEGSRSARTMVWVAAERSSPAMTGTLKARSSPQRWPSARICSRLGWGVCSGDGRHQGLARRARGR